MNRRKIRVLVADNHPAVLLATSDLVEEYQDVEVIAMALNVAEVVRSSLDERPDLVLIDAWLSGGGSELATSEIKRVSPDTAIVVLASYEEAELRRRLEAVGAIGCYDKQELGRVLPEILSTIRRP